MRYTYYNGDLARYVVPCLYKPDGEQVKFYFKTESEERTYDGGLLLTPSVELVFGEVIDRLAALENLQERSPSISDCITGKWRKRKNERTCSECEFTYYSNKDGWRYCPNCGAKMKGE
jgi:hypothetical protein